jgi:uncharacterized protein involved in outer membrane biogenesis
MRRGARIAVGAGVVLAAVLAGLAIAFVWGIAVPGEFLRAPLERALTAAFGVPTRIEGPIELRTGLAAFARADALVLADPAGPAGATLARGQRPGVGIDLLALARRVVVLEEVTGERLELNLVRAADGRANWAPIFASAPGAKPPPVAFGGIGRLRLGVVAGTYRSGAADPLRFEIAGLDGGLPLRDPTTARGAATVAGHAFAFDLRTASLTNLGAAGAATPVQGTVAWSGARFALDGRVAPDGARFDASVHATTDDASALLAALGVAAHRPGRLDARGRVGVAATNARVEDLALTLGESAISGQATVAWDGPRLRIAASLAGERVDAAPFLGVAPATDKTAAELLVELLERAATDVDAEIKASVAELAGLPVVARALELDGRSGELAVAVRARGEVSGTRASATLDYDARKPQRVLAARVEGGVVSTQRLPPGARPDALTGTSGGIRGQARGQGTSPRAVVASLQASLEARDVSWRHAGRDGKPLSGRFDTVRIAVQGTRASSVEVAAKLGNAACALKAAGGALGPLLEGKQWPLQLTGTCPGARLNAKGHITLASRHVAANLAFDAAADRIGPIARAIGIAPTAPHPFAARGALAVDAARAHARLDAFRIGRTTGSGEVDLPLGREGIPRVQFAYGTVDVAELNALADAAPPSANPLDRVVFREKLRLPEADFQITADRVLLAGETLRRLRLGGAMRALQLPPTAFGFEWQSAPVTGTFGADFSGTAPRMQLDARARDIDLGALSARLGAKGIGVRAGALTLHVRSEGERLGELLSAADVDAAIERGRLDLSRAPVGGLPRQADFAATLKAAPGAPAAFSARGTAGGEPFELAVDSPSLAGLARAGAPMPATLRAALGDMRAQVGGTFARDGTGDARVELSGARLDRLGKLAGVDLPAIGPYAARGTIVVTADAVQASSLDVSFGKSRVSGTAEFQIRRAGRATHSATLRAPTLHLEDLGAARWIGGPAGAKAAPAGEAPAAQRREAEISRALEWLRAVDVNVSVDVDALHGGAERFASGRVRATLSAGRLRVELQDVKTASGVVGADIRIDARGAQPKFAARARVEALDFGPLARTLDPATKLGGRVDLVADLAAQGPPGQLLPALSGTVDVAVFPHDLSSGALDFWGTGLLGAMLRSLDPNTKSEVECAAASLNIAGGVASTSAFFVDTTRVRIVGQVEANIMTRALSGRLRPVSEQPELFTVAPTMLIGGTMEDPRVSVAPENLVLAPLRFATPLAGFALDFVGARGKPIEGRVGCREAYERARALRASGGGPR